MIISRSPGKVAQAAEKKRGLAAGDVVPLPVELPLEHAPHLRPGHAAVPGIHSREFSSRQASELPEVRRTAAVYAEDGPKDIPSSAILHQILFGRLFLAGKCAVNALVEKYGGLGVMFFFW